MNYTSSFFDEIIDDSLSSAGVVVPRVLSIVKPESVVDVGCATGAWLSVSRWIRDRPASLPGLGFRGA